MIRLCAFLLFLALPAAAAAQTACPPGQTAMLTARLYFGQSMNGGKVPVAAWRDFVARMVTPRFPDGFTVYDAQGQWRDPSDQRARRENTKVIEIAAPDTQGFHDAIETLRRAYAARFHQQAVGLFTVPGCGNFR